MVSAVVLLLMATPAAGSVITPRFVLSEEYVFNSAVNTINNVGMNTPVHDGHSMATALAVTHVYHGGYAGSFATTAPGGGAADFFASIGADRSVEIVYDLTGGGDTPVDSVLFWQYENDGGGTARAGNHARTIEIRLNAEADGPTLFTGPPVTVTLLPVMDGDADTANDLGGINTAQAYPLGDLCGRYVQISITDNYYGLQGMTNGGDRVGLGEIRFASATLPAVVPGKTWLMVVHAHPDDEGIFFGGVLPYYARVLGLPTVLVDMTTGWLNADGTRTPDSYTREAELWEAGVRYGLHDGPQFALFQQTDWNLSIDNSWDRWADFVTDGDDVADGQRKSSRRLAELIRTYRPEVIATHDFRGEYGHPDHKALAYATAAAWDLAAGRETIIDDGITPPVTVTPDGVAGEPWEAKKLYIHSYEQHRLFHDCWETVSIDVDDDGAADSTPRQVSNNALDAHVSQGRPHVATVYDPLANGGNSWDVHPSEWWGLYASTVGPDSTADDFSEEGRLYSGWARGDFTDNLAVPPPVSCSVDVDVLEFDAVEIGEASTLEFVITNTGRQAISGTLELIGSACDCYSIVPGTESYDLAYGDAHVVGVEFAPQQGSSGQDCQIDTGSPTCGIVLLSGDMTGIPDPGICGRLFTYPNPFNPQVDVAFSLSREQRAQISVYDLSGRRRAVLADRVFAAGDHALGWNGREDGGGSVPSGVYLVLLRTETDEQIEKVMLVR